MVDIRRRSSEYTRAGRHPEELSSLPCSVKVRLMLRTTQHPMRYANVYASELIAPDIAPNAASNEATPAFTLLSHCTCNGWWYRYFARTDAVSITCSSVYL